MSPERNRTPARLLAPLALGACTIVFFAIVLSAGGGGSKGGTGGGGGASVTGASTQVSATARRIRSQGTYTVKTGDTLAGIADRVGLTVERLQELNPQLDPQALVSGQKIKLRE